MSRTKKDTPKSKSDRRHRCNCARCQHNRCHSAIVQEHAAEYDRQLWQAGERLRAIECHEYEYDEAKYEEQCLRQWQQVDANTAASITADDYVAMMRQWAADDDEALLEADNRKWRNRG